MTKAEEKARKMIAGLSVKSLVEQFELTNEVTGENVSVVRGWLMDELEKRDPKAFDKWIDDYADSPRAYFLREEVRA